MNRVDERLSELLHGATSVPPVDVSFEAIARRVRRRRRVAAVSTAVSVCAAVTVGLVAVPSLMLGDRNSGADRPADSSATATNRPKPSVPGLSPAGAAEIERTCTNPPLPQRNTRFRDDLKTPFHVYNRLLSPTGSFSVLYNDKVVALCGSDSRLPNRMQNIVGSLHGRQIDWLPGDLLVDAAIVEPGGVSAYDGKTIRPAQQLLQVLAGRVSSRVAKVTFVGPDGSTTTVTPINGTFVALNYLEKASAEAISAAQSGGAVVGTVRVFDASGHLLAEQDPNFPFPVGCFLRPDGTTTYGVEPRPGESCSPATPWQR